MKSGPSAATRPAPASRSIESDAGERTLAVAPPRSGLAFVDGDRPSWPAAPIQCSRKPHGASGPGPGSSPLQRVVAGDGRAHSGAGIPDALKSGILERSGLDLSSVQVHANSVEPARFSALAFARGDHIHLAPGQERHLPHEAWHVVQQRQGRVAPTLRENGAAINDDPRLEREAESVGRELARYRPPASAAPPAAPPDASGRVPSSNLTDGVVQRAYELNRPVDVTTKRFDHRALELRVENLSGQSLGPAANSPSVSPFGWDELWNAGHTLGHRGAHSSHYNAVRMHLWNGRLGGPGNEKWNLAPGPAKVNSMMSAGPETSAKLLVDAGHSVWLHTTLGYLNHSTNANDFTSVVPHRIDMEWGVMGHAASGTWGSDIDLPVAPLSGPAALEYQTWDPNDAPGLVHKLSTASDQVRAQAYDLVPDDALRLAILQAYPQIYQGMDQLAQGQVLQKLSDPDLATFVGSLGPDPEQLIHLAVLPLAGVGEAMRAQRVFGALTPQQQRAMLLAFKGPLLQHLGAIGDAFSKTDATIFEYNARMQKARLLGELAAANQLNAFLAPRSRPQRKQLFDLWASENGQGANPGAKKAFINGQTNVSLIYKLAYADDMDAEQAALHYLATHADRSKRRAKKPAGPVGITKPRTIKKAKHR